MAKEFDEIKGWRKKPLISKNSQKIIDKKKNGWIPIYEQERIQQVQKRHQRLIRGIADKVNQEKMIKQQEEDQELLKQYHNLKKIPLNKFEEKYIRQMETYQQQIKLREDVKNQRVADECTFTPQTNHTVKNVKKQQLNATHKENNRSINVVQRMEQYQKFRDTKLEKRKRDLTPNFKPRVLENYNSSRKGSKSRKMKSSKSQVFSNKKDPDWKNEVQVKVQKVQMKRTNTTSIQKLQKVNSDVRQSWGAPTHKAKNLEKWGYQNIRFKNMKTSVDSSCRVRDSKTSSKCSNDLVSYEIQFNEQHQDIWPDATKSTIEMQTLGHVKSDKDNIFEAEKNEIFLEENFMSPTFMLDGEQKEYTKSPTQFKTETVDASSVDSRILPSKWQDMSGSRQKKPKSPSNNAFETFEKYVKKHNLPFTIYIPLTFS